MAVLLLGPFFVLTAYALFQGARSGSAPAPLSQVDVLGGILVAMWNYMGWDNSSTIAGEVERPQRTYPLAMLGAVALVAVTYVLPIAAVSMTGFDANRWSTGGWADVARATLHNSAAGVAVAFAITAGGMLGAVGSLNAYVLALPRLPALGHSNLPLAEDGFLPKAFARRHPRTGAPWVAILACAAAWALCLGLPFVKLIVLDVLLTGLSILLEFAALVFLRIREPGLPRPYRVPGGLFGAIAIGIPPAILLVLTALRNQAEPVGPMNALVFGGILIALGWVVYALGRPFRAG